MSEAEPVCCICTGARGGSECKWNETGFLPWICSAHHSRAWCNQIQRHPSLNPPAEAICLHKGPASKAVLVWLRNRWSRDGKIHSLVRAQTHTHFHTYTKCDTKQCLSTGSGQGATLPSAQVIMMMLHQCQWAGAEAIWSIHVQRKTHTHTHTIRVISCLFWIYGCLMRVITYCILVFISLLLALCSLSFWLSPLSLTHSAT